MQISVGVRGIRARTERWVHLALPARSHRLRIVERGDRSRLREITAIHQRVGNGFGNARIRALRNAIEVAEEEQLLLAGQDPGNINRSANVTAEFLVNIFRDRRLHYRSVEVSARIQRRVLVIPPSAAMEVVAAALGGDANGGASSLALLGVEVVSGDGDGFDRVGRRDVGDEVRQPAVIVDGAVNARGVAVVRVAVHVHRQGARGVAANGVLFLYLGSAGNQRVEFFVIAALGRGDGQFRDLYLVDIAVHFGSFGLQLRRSLGDRNLRGYTCGLQGHVDAHLLVDLDPDILLGEAAEVSHPRDRKRVRAG